MRLGRSLFAVITKPASSLSLIIATSRRQSQPDKLKDKSIASMINKLLCLSAGGVQPPYALPNKTRRLLTARAACINRTLDFNRPHLDIVFQRGS